MSDITKKLIELLDNFPYDINDYIGDNKHFIIDDHVELAKYLISNDVMIQQYGQWVVDDDLIHCSVCGYKTSALISYIDNGDKWVPLYANKYCGNCGAKMEDE